MQITAGFNSADDYEALAAAGADELFLGYVPFAWAERFGTTVPMNRREVMLCNVQLGGESELRILSEMIRDIGVPAAIALNALVVSPAQYSFIREYILHCAELGFTRFIIADPGLLVYLHSAGITEQLQIHVSGEYGELNRSEIIQLEKLGAKRVIFHRHMSVYDMAACISAAHQSSKMEFEAFLLNEKCHFHGAYCSSVHCDELPPMCRVPYILSGYSGPSVEDRDEAEHFSDCTGSSGCALCALPEMKQAGITHLKIVGRGNHSDRIIEDVRSAKLALQLLEESSSAQEFKKRLKTDLLGGACSGNCYYSVI